MSSSDKQPRRYDAPRRQAAAARRRETVIGAAKDAFEQHGWSGTTIRDIADGARVSPKTVEAVFGTKAALLRAAVDYAIRGDVDPTPMPRRETIREMEDARDAPTMLRLHAGHLRRINPRSARIAWVVEQAAGSDESVGALWQQMNENRTYGVRWAVRTLLTKPGRKRGLTPSTAEPVFWVAVDWGTFRTLSDDADLDVDGYENWLRSYYAAMLLPPGRVCARQRRR
jgi:AcrR family transcriptional regulator